MASKTIKTVSRILSGRLPKSFLNAKIILPSSSIVPVREKRSYMMRPSVRKAWHVRKWTETRDENLLPETERFIQDVIINKYTSENTPLKEAPWERNEFQFNTKRTGVLALKLGTLLQWTQDGRSFIVTLLQVLDNHVINYVPPEEYENYPSFQYYHKGKFGLQIVGALGCDPRMFSKPYNNLFLKSGVPTKRWLTRFLITPDAAVQPGTPLNVNHFKIGQYVDVQARTEDHGFQGVMKRWKMKGMPATHGVTKAHRKMGASGGGGAKGGVWRGKHMPGIMGNQLRYQRGLKIWRINTKYNVLYVHGRVPGSAHTLARVHDTRLPNKRPRQEDEMPMPTFMPDDFTDDMPEEYFHENLFQFTQPSIDMKPPTEKKNIN